MGVPVSANEDGINIRPELMEREKLYHCIFKGKAMLLFKDSQDVLSCYEVEDADLVERIRNVGDGDLSGMLQEFLKKKGGSAP